MTEGARSASPAATIRMASTKPLGGTSLSRNPLAPARSAWTTFSSASNVVRTRTVASARGRPRIRRVASTPSMTGIRMSITTTSGRRRRRRRPRLPSAASPTTSISGWSSRIIRNPVRTSCWSSTSRTRMVMSRRPRRGLGVIGSVADTRKPPGAGPASSRPPKDGDPLAHPDQPATGLAGHADAATARAAAVRDLDLQLGGTVGDACRADAPLACLRLFVRASWTIR